VYSLTVASTSAKTAVTQFYNQWICKFGIPLLITSDGGTAFSSHLSTTSSRRTWSCGDCLIYPVCFALNSGYSQVLGTSAFKVIHGTEPRQPLMAAVQRMKLKPRESNDPVDYVHNLMVESAEMVKQVQALQTKAYEKA